MNPITEQALGAEALRHAVRGTVHVPGDAFYAGACTAFNVAVDQRPAAVVEPVDAHDVAAVVRHARANGLGVAPQATGHGATGIGPEAILLRTGMLDGVAVDPERRVARAGAAARWEDVLAAAAEHGLAGRSGSSGDVGVVGYSLGGGIGWFARSHGFGADAILAAEVVTAAGEVVRVDDESDPELMWALRGGGGSFAIVTALEIELHPAPALYGGQMVWPGEDAEPVLRAWRNWVDTLPETASATATMVTTPPLEEIPEPIRGRSIVMVGFVHQGGEAEARELLAPLVGGLGPMLISTVAPLPITALGEVAMDPREPLPYDMRGHLLADVSDATIDALLEIGEPSSGSPITMLQLRHLGGALARGGDRSAAGRIVEPFLLYGVGATPEPSVAGLVAERFGELARAISPWATGRRALTFAKGGEDVGAAYEEPALARLSALRAERDPEGILRANHPIPAR